MSESHYDVAIIGAGMSGLAAGIRLAHFGKRVCILERHNAPGGLNSFYSIAGRKFDVGLHAMTNFVPAGVKGTPLGKLLRQLRIEREAFDLCQQLRSRIAFPGVELAFSNDFSLLQSEVERAFPAERDGFQRLLGAIRSFDELSLQAPDLSARQVLGRHLRDPLLTDMLLCPLMYYGSAREHDMDFAQFVIMFKSIFLEGFARPFEGVRVVIRVLLEKFRQAGGVRRMKCGVRQIRREAGRAAALVLDSGEEVRAGQVLSSIGLPETLALCRPALAEVPAVRPGQLSFVETLRVLRGTPAELGWGRDTIVFFNDAERFSYAPPEEAVDLRSGVICFPDNFQYGERRQAEGMVRVTCLASFRRWDGMAEEAYRGAKLQWFARIQESARRFLPPLREGMLEDATVATDMFTPRTIRKFTGHWNGAVYGAPEKVRDGRTPLNNLFLCGTDQGFLGIVGAMLSGISMANYHILQGKAQ